MSKKPKTKKQIRISFLLDLDNNPELADLEHMNGHGDRPRELLRLAIRGAKLEQKEREIIEAARLAGIDGSTQRVPKPVASEPSAPAPSTNTISTQDDAPKQNVQKTAGHTQPEPQKQKERVAPSGASAASSMDNFLA